MSRLTRSVLREVWPMYLGGVLLFLFLQMTDVLSSTASAFLQFHTGLPTAAHLLSLQLPALFNRCLVLAVPFALLLAYGRMGKDSEIKALYAGGVHPWRLLAPLFAPALVVGLLTFVNASEVAPRCLSIYWDSFYTQVFHQPVPPPTTASYAYSQGEEVFTAGQVMSVSAGTQAASTPATLSGVLVHTPQGTYTAFSGLWDTAHQRWTLPSGVLVTPSGQVQPFTQPVSFTQRDHPSQPPRPAPQNTSAQLRAQLNQQKLGHQKQATNTPTEQTRRTEFELSRRTADSFTPLIFVLAAGTLGLGLSSRSWAVGAVIAFLVCFYALYSTMPQLAATGALSPLLAAWLPSLAFGVLGLYLGWRLR